MRKLHFLRGNHGFTWFMGSCFFAWFALFIGGLINYPGTKLIYIVFSLVFLLLLVSAFYRQISYGYLFLVVFLWLGFWLKLTVHLVLDYRYGEPTGSFDGSPGSMDAVLQIVLVAVIGTVAARMLFGRIKTTSTMVFTSHLAPSWYLPIRRWLWALTMVAIVAIAGFNAVYGVLKIGLVPTTILPWPLNAVISWLLGIGLAMTVTTLVFWDITLRKNVVAGAYAILVEALCSTVSILSRGTYIFHAIPAAVAYIKNYRYLNISGAKAAVLVVSLGVLFLVSLTLVSALRNYYFAHDQRIIELGVWRGFEAGMGTVEKESVEKEGAGKEGAGKGDAGKGDAGKEGADEPPGFYRAAGGFISQISHLAVDRWIGLEGVMAVYSYPNKRPELLVDGLMEQPAIGKATLYQRIAQSHYRLMDMSKYQFASIPGAPAFFYYSGSLLVVCLGMFILTLLVLVTEAIVYSLAENPMLCALYGMDAANAVAQFGLAPRQLVIHFFMTFIGILFIWLIQSKQVAAWFGKLAQGSSN